MPTIIFGFARHSLTGKTSTGIIGSSLEWTTRVGFATLPTFIRQEAAK